MASLDRLLAFYVESGVDGLTLLGQMGEAPKLSQTESVAIVAKTLAHNDLPVVVGVSAAGFHAMKELTDKVMSLGAAGVMVAPPVNLRTDDQIVGYYFGVPNALGPDVPIMVQD